ncbi:NAD(P)/FAD-dependent oxidoreductase [Pukyongiella litopenaei]|uniref:FAD-binding oxidoreductase n=1 Tax=Pukyongiella litopenaei TaxID=2605946 RepID=A0A2S0MVB9_9RHOB|nr:FAD-dependent oxidoreductase [Pukyongiella litopenaei]AVO39661.1 FAD-binding oxidoreductase [Pukyongiella litopenaei]
MSAEQFDIAIVGAGIAGASFAAALGARGRVVLLEMEDAPGHHATGRSAALFSMTYGPAPIRALSRASEAFYLSPPAGFADHPLLTPRGMVMPARADQLGALEAMMDEIGPNGPAQVVDGARARELCPLLRDGYAVSAMWDDAARDIDVNALHMGFLRQVRAAGGDLRLRAGVTGLARVGDAWEIETRAGPIRAGIVVNAAGAWADELGSMAGAVATGLQPRRRSAAIVEAPFGLDLAGLRMLVDIEEQFYLKPEAGKLLISPADETPTPPCDAWPDDMDIAIAVDRIETACELSVRRIERSWAGLRSFVADGCPVVGYDPRAEGFFWLAGQGGYGIQTAPALGRLAAALAEGRAVPGDIIDQGLDPSGLAPRAERFPQ